MLRHLIVAAAAMLSVVAYAQNITIDGKIDDWSKVPVAVSDPKDMTAANIHGDYKEIKVASSDTTLFVLQTVYGTAAPGDAFRYYYHVLIDADNSAATGIKNDAYEGTPTGVKDVIGSEFYIQIGRRNGADDGIEVYHLESGEVVFADFPHAYSGDSIELSVDFNKFVVPQGFQQTKMFQKGQTIRIAAYQEGNADGWGPIDWTEPASHIVGKPAAVEPGGKLPLTWAVLRR